MSELAQYFHQGGAFMYAIAIMSAFGIAIIIERIIFIMFRYNTNGKVFMDQIEKLIQQDSIDRAIKLCNADQGAALCDVVKTGLVKANKSTEEIQNSVDETTLAVLPKLQKRTPYLAMIANVSTLLGLLGTIQGLIVAFQSINLEDAVSRSDALAQGIAIAMYTTAFGLIVAIPCMISHSILQNKTTKIIDEIDQYSVKLINLLTIRQHSLKHQGETTGIVK